MGQQLRRGSKKSNRVRQLRVQLKRSLVHPLGMYRERERRPERLKYMDSQTTNLSSRRLDDPQQLLAKLYLLTRRWLKPDKDMNRQVTPP
jgi:hypothetical protein